MNPSLTQLLNNFYDQVMPFFLQRGFSEQEATLQLDELGKVALAKTFVELLKQKSSGQKFASDDEAANYIQANFTQGEIKRVLDQQAKQLLTQYAEELNAEPPTETIASPTVA